MFGNEDDVVHFSKTLDMQEDNKKNDSNDASKNNTSQTENKPEPKPIVMPDYSTNDGGERRDYGSTEKKETR